MNLDKVQFTEVFQYWNSAEFRKLQTTLTKTANCIQQDALNNRVTPLLSPNEVNTLKQAAQILLNFKIKVEHAKEVKIREEKRRKQKLKELEKRRIQLINEELSLENKPSHYVEIISWRLALGNHFESYFGMGTYFPGNKLVESRLEHAKRRYTHFTWKDMMSSFIREIHDAIEDRLWLYDEEPTKKKLVEFIHLVRTEWMKDFSAMDRRIIDAVQEEATAQGFVVQCKMSSMKIVE